jgi:drug/metabolite transporter (DMT)-like permease
MPYLVAVSLLWAFSFGLTKGLTAGLDGSFVAACRLGLAFLVFAPLLRLEVLAARTMFRLAAIGAVQFGLMYLAYNESFRHLAAYEVALFTLTTPVLVTLLADALDRSFRIRALAAALLAIAGTAVIVWSGQQVRPSLTGLLWVQLSNLAFSLGQVAYRRLRREDPALRDRDIFALLYAGAFAACVIVAVARYDPATFTPTLAQIKTLLYLGILASGLGFFLWNRGATQVSAGTLAVMNNAKVPLAVACSLLFFGETADLPRLALSLALLGLAVWLAHEKPRDSVPHPDARQ